MKLPLTVMLLAGASLMQAAPGQGGVAMSVRTAIGIVGYVCEPFQCLPNQTLAALGEDVEIEVYGRSLAPYVLFGGMPVVGCQPFPGLTGGLALWSPIVTLHIGGIGATGIGNDCNADVAEHKFQVPTNVPVGVQFRLQAVTFAGTDEGLGFTRAVEIHTR
ncbi:MAG: hypothetical protein H6838_20155 [Planctomycetes bacterium]|nr:hypothetical protein [Planctomycetota bacterium]